MKNSTLIVTLIVSMSFLASCSGSGNSRSSFEASKGGDISGYVGASNIANALVYAVPVDEQGQPELNEEGTEYVGNKIYSTDDAFYKLSFAKENTNGAMLFIANSAKKKARQTCELVSKCGGVPYKGEIAIETTTDSAGSFKLTAAVAHAKDGLTVQVNWITSLAAELAYASYHDVDWQSADAIAEEPSKFASGMFTAFTIEKGNLWQSQQFKISDVISIRPIPPSDIKKFASLPANELQEGIYYGAVLAAGQKIAIDSGETEAQWLSKVIKQQRDLYGQLYVNHSDSAEFSLCQLYTAADFVLSQNIQQQSNLPSAAGQALAKIKSAKTSSCAAASETQTAVDVKVKDVEDWLDQFALTKAFLTDLDERIGNFRGDAPGTCPEWKSSPQESCVDSFYKREVVVATQSYFNDTLNPLVENALKLAAPKLIDSVLALTAQIAKDPNDHTLEEDGLTIRLNLETSVKAESDSKKYSAFDFDISGVQKFGDIELAYETRTTTEVVEPARLRIVYEVPTALPLETLVATVPDVSPVTDPEKQAEAFGFDLFLPKVNIAGHGAGSLSTPLITFMSQMKLIGVKPIYEPTAPYHYNFTEIDFNLGDVIGKVTKGEYQGELRHTDIIFSAKSTNAPNYYARHVWPKVEDFFTLDAGGNVPLMTVIPDLFTYTLIKDVPVIYQITCSAGYNENGVCKDDPNEIKKNADYFQLNTKDVGANRFELFEDDKGKQTLRQCAIAMTGTDQEKEASKVCLAEKTVKGELQSDGTYLKFYLDTDLLHKEGETISQFAIPAYGLYAVKYPRNTEGLIDIDWDTESTVDGERIAGFRQGIDMMSLQITQALYDAIDSEGAAIRKPSTITKINFNKQTDFDWEVAISTGYDFDALIGPYPTGSGGKNTQSLYFSYFIKDMPTADSDDRFVTELSSLMVFRGGVSLLGKEATSYGATLARTNGYKITDGEDEIVSCKADTNLDHECRTDAIAYLSFRGRLVGIIREERKGRYIARFSDGDYLELNGLSTFKATDALPVTLPFLNN